MVRHVISTETERTSIRQFGKNKKNRRSLGCARDDRQPYSTMLFFIKDKIRSLVPRGLIALYHRLLSLAAAFFYGFPSRRMVVFGVTGTKGKSTVCYLIARILEQAGRRVGMTTTPLMKVGPREWLNVSKITMLGRFSLQRFLRRMDGERVETAIVESSSEGLAQWRQAGISYDVAVFTNLTPEHIESHGSWEKYMAAKGRLFAALHTRRPFRKKIRGKSVSKVAVANEDDPAASYFLSFPADEYWTFGMNPTAKNPRPERHLQIQDLELSPEGSTFAIKGVRFSLHLLGRSNVMNAAAAIAAASSGGISLETAAAALRAVYGIPGRFERIEEGQDFTVIVDYAHEPASFKQLYEAVAVLPKKRIIHVFGSTGGGRDRSRRPILGELAGRNADIVIVTTDDPYDEDPAAISAAVIAGARQAGKVLGENLLDILDRREAIRAAVRLAEPGDLLLITGKGSEQRMALARGRKIPWDDREVTRSAIHSGGATVEVIGKRV
ncbi:UDP-N-acetylmuramoyl-L-alanyl-D-glutamate--2,6-diaminopimelate ligase [Patescibacteria group bacterium]|nr:MAG: UDP-N-acetylmuramoyl-L-alanyl-D-glutamate--2,6-diaminopimelate ligase [Patescibacteria group bacterium]